MPVITLALGQLALGALATKNSISISKKNKERLNVNNYAEAKFSDAKAMAEWARKQTNESLIKLGENKLNVLNNAMGEFVNTFNKILCAKLRESSQELEQYEKELAEIQKMRDLIKSVNYSGKSNGDIKPATMFGAYGLLSYCAKNIFMLPLPASFTNATLSFLGGASVVFSSPAVSVLGIVMNISASNKLDMAYADKAEALKAAEGMNVIATLCESITVRAEMFNNLLDELSAWLLVVVKDIKKIIDERGTNFSAYSKNEKLVVSMAASIATSIREVIDTSILDEDGNLTEKSEKVQNNISDFLKSNSMILNEANVETNTELRYINDKSDVTDENNVYAENLTPEEETVKEIEDFLRKEHYGKGRSEFSKGELERMLSDFQTEDYGDEVDDILGLYNAEMDFNKTNGILFLKDKLYYKLKKDKLSVSIRYKNIGGAIVHDFSFTMDVYLRTYSHITFKTMMYTTQELADLFEKIHTIFGEDS